MSANSTRTIIWANGEDQFCLAKIGLLLDLESKCNAPIGKIFGRLGTGEFSVNDIRETIRLGLMGGGMPPEKAMNAVKIHVDGNPLATSVLVAYAVLEAVLVGVPEDPLEGKAKPEAQEAGSSTTTGASADLNSSSSEESSDGLPESSKIRLSGKSSATSTGTTRQTETASLNL